VNEDDSEVFLTFAKSFVKRTLPIPALQIIIESVVFNRNYAYRNNVISTYYIRPLIYIKEPFEYDVFLTPVAGGLHPFPLCTRVQATSSARADFTGSRGTSVYVYILLYCLPKQNAIVIS